jgi:hypothetical protein
VRGLNWGIPKVVEEYRSRSFTIRVVKDSCCLATEAVTAMPRLKSLRLPVRQKEQKVSAVR